jgi:type II secretion system protein H
MRLELSSRRGSSAFTLIELMVVIVIIGIMTAMIIPEMKGSYEDALLRSASRDLVNVFDLAYSRAVSLNQLRRVRLDETTGRYMVEKRVILNGREDFIPAGDVPGDKGALDSRISIEFRRPDDNSAEPAALSGAAATDGASPMNEAAITFYPDGTADPGEIVLRDRQGFRLALRINPITARVHVVELERE